MKPISFLVALAALLFAGWAQAEDFTPLPFTVILGGQAAQIKGSAAEAVHATIDKPVAANALLEVGAKAEMIIVNVVTANDNGTPVEGATPAAIILQGTTKTTIDKTMDGKKLSPGNYLMAVVADGKTANVFFKIE